MTHYQLTLASDVLQRLFGENDQLAHLLEAVLNQVLEAQVAEHVQAEPYERTVERRGYRNGYKPRQLTTRVGTLALRVPQVRDGRSSPRTSVLCSSGRRQKQSFKRCAVGAPPVLLKRRALGATANRPSCRSSVSPWSRPHLAP